MKIHIVRNVCILKITKARVGGYGRMALKHVNYHM